MRPSIAAQSLAQAPTPFVWPTVMIVPSVTHRQNYEHERALFAAACEREGIPTGIPIPREVFDLADRAWALRDAPTREQRLLIDWYSADGPCRDDAPAIWGRARAVLAGCRETEMLDAMAEAIPCP